MGSRARGATLCLGACQVNYIGAGPSTEPEADALPPLVLIHGFGASVYHWRSEQKRWGPTLPHMHITQCTCPARSTLYSFASFESNS